MNYKQGKLESTILGSIHLNGDSVLLEQGSPETSRKIVVKVK